MTDSNTATDTLPEMTGVPLGGVGTGYVEVDRRGRFRNAAINNNRTSDTILADVDGAFLGLRIKQDDRSSACILQSETALPFEEAGIASPCLNKRLFNWTPLYPSATYSLTGLSVPLEFSWRALSPVIPFDTEASMLPGFLVMMNFKNIGTSPCEVSGLFCWENLRGCTASERPADRGRIVRADLDEHDRFSAVSEFYRGLKLQEGEVFPIGLHYGKGELVRTNAEGDHAVLCAPRPDTPISFASFDGYDAADLRALWAGFAETGALPNRLSESPAAHCGAVCQQRRVEPGESFRFVFVCTWHCPRFFVDGEDLGNGYTNHYTNAFEAGLYLVEYHDLLVKAVDEWQGRLTGSTLPGWYARMLINASAVLTTNSIHTAAQDFSLFESPDAPVCSALDRHFYASIGTSIFFPTFAEREIAGLASGDDPKAPGRLYRHLGEGAPVKPSYTWPGEAEAVDHVDIYAKYLLLMYRNFHMSGRLASLMNQFPKAEAVLKRAAMLDKNSDGAPDASGACTTFAGWNVSGFDCYTAGLWTAALFAYADMARRRNKEEDAARVEALAERCLQHFETHLWSETKQYYEHASGPDALPQTADACHLAQLAGPWMATFMRLRPGGTKGWPRPLFDDTRVTAAAHAIRKRNARSTGFCLVATAKGKPIPEEQHEMPPPGTEGVYPAFVGSLLACPLIYQDEAAAGLSVLYTLYQNLHEHGRTLNHPFAWDPNSGDPVGWGRQRHVSSLAVWYSYYAFQGLFLSVPDKTLFIAPNLPKGVHSFRAPLFTPVCLGSLEWSEREEGRYQQRVTVSFDSPIHIERLELETPPLDCEFEVFIKTEEDVSRAEHAVFAGVRRNTVRIELNAPVLVQEPMSVTLRQLK